MTYTPKYLIHDKKEFDALFDIYQECLRQLRLETDTNKLLFFDSTLSTWLELLSTMAKFIKEDLFVLGNFSDYTIDIHRQYTPGIYPATIVDIREDGDLFIERLWEDPCQALGLTINSVPRRCSLLPAANNTHVFPLSGKWFLYSDSYEEVAVLHAAPAIIEIAINKLKAEENIEPIESNDFYMHDE